MTTMQGDIVNRVKRFPKPSSPAEALQPVFEAVSNSLHAVEDGFGEALYQSMGSITVSIRNPRSLDDIEIIVDDNGIGLEPPKFTAFCTTDTDYKMARGGKGVGRLLWLDAFERIKVVSIYKDGDRLFRRSFSFRLKSTDQITEEEVAEIGAGSNTGTSITFSGLRGSAYRTKFPSQAATIVKHFGSHFFADFILGKSPRITVDIDGNSTIFPEEIQNLKIEDRGVSTLSTEDFGELSLASFVCHKNASANFDGSHQIHLVANGRTVTTRKIDGLIGIGRFGPDSDRVYHGCVSGDYLNERVNQERTQFNFDESIVEEIVRQCAAFVRSDAIGDEIREFDTQRLRKLRDFVKDYPSFGFEEAEQLLERTPKNAVEPEQFAKALITIRIRRDKERNETIQKIVAKLGGNQTIPSDFAEAVREAANEI